MLKASILSNSLSIGHEGQVCDGLVQLNVPREGGGQSDLKDLQLYADHGYHIHNTTSLVRKLVVVVS